MVDLSSSGTSSQTEAGEESDVWIACSLAAVTFQLFRLSIDSIQTASRKTSKDFVEDHHKVSETQTQTTEALETDPLILQRTTTTTSRHVIFQPVPTRSKAAVWSFRVQILLCILLLIDAILGLASIVPSIAVWSSLSVVILGALLTVRDLKRERLGTMSRVFYVAAALTMWAPICLNYYKGRPASVSGDEIILNSMGMYLLLSVAECCFLDLPYQRQEAVTALDDTSPSKKKTLSRSAILTLLKPYFWPDETADSAMVNRFRAILTWICVILSKICNLISPMYIGWASTALAHEDYLSCAIYAIIYSVIQFFGATLKEGQSLIYLKVAQAAFVQLSETTFAHLHSLSLDWHLRKKLGEVIRSMDRGIAAWYVIDMIPLNTSVFISVSQQAHRSPLNSVLSKRYTDEVPLLVACSSTCRMRRCMHYFCHIFPVHPTCR